MTSSLMNKFLVGRASAILTASEVAAATLNLNAGRGDVGVELAFTKGSLTNVLVRGYVSADGQAWHAVKAAGSAAAVETVAADDSSAIQFSGLGGWRFFRVTLQGTGTPAGSLAAVTYRYLRRD